MNALLTRRRLLACAGLAPLLRAGLAADLTPGAAARAPVVPFALRDVRLLAGPALDAANVNRNYLLGLDPDRLLHTFRLTAGLPTLAEPLGGWEAPGNELRGHFTGHYLSACALQNAHAADTAAKQRGDLVVRELARCQASMGNGYLSAFPEEMFDRLRAGKPAWAPFYTLHKIMAGMLDMHLLCGNEQARQVLDGMVAWTARWVQPLGDEHMARVLEREYGGMNELLYSYAALTGEQRWSELAARFDHERIFAPLAAGRDELRGLHVNTTIPKIVGAARGYEVTGEPRLRRLSNYFWQTVTGRRCYCTGGTSNGESWNAPPGELAKELSGYTQESCVTYNLQKLTRHVFGWTGDARAADYYERAFYNGILGVQAPDGAKLYYLPLQGGFWKLFGTPLHDFWCCSGSMAEAFAKLGDSIYFRDTDGAGLYVNLFVASQLDWPEMGLRLEQHTRFPGEPLTRLTLRLRKPRRLALRIRIPAWIDGGSASLNGRTLEAFATPSSYLVLDRTWHDGDRVELALPMKLHAEPMPDDPTLVAAMYGPLVLAGRLGNAGLDANTLRAGPTKPRTVPEYPLEPIAVAPIVARGVDPANWLRQAGAHEFRTIGQEHELSLVPLNDIVGERFAVYWRLQTT